MKSSFDLYHSNTEGKTWNRYPAGSHSWTKAWMLRHGRFAGCYYPVLVRPSTGEIVAHHIEDLRTLVRFINTHLKHDYPKPK